MSKGIKYQVDMNVPAYKPEAHIAYLVPRNQFEQMISTLKGCSYSHDLISGAIWASISLSITASFALLAIWTETVEPWKKPAFVFAAILGILLAIVSYIYHRSMMAGEKSVVENVVRMLETIQQSFDDTREKPQADGGKTQFIVAGRRVIIPGGKGLVSYGHNPRIIVKE